MSDLLVFLVPDLRRSRKQLIPVEAQRYKKKKKRMNMGGG
jgi:hypothetical protein